MSHNPSTPEMELKSTKIEEMKQEISDARSEGNGEEEKPDVKPIDQLLPENEELKKSQELEILLQNMDLNKQESLSGAEESGEVEDDEAEEQPSSEQYTQPILDLDKVDLEDHIKNYVKEIGSLEKLLENSHCLLAKIAPTEAATVRMPGPEKPCKEPCRYCWDPERCDCKEKMIVFMAQCLECGKKYALIRETLAGSGVFLDQFQGVGNGIYIGKTDGAAKIRFSNLIRQEALMKHWKNVHPTLPKPNDVRLYKFLGIYQGLYLREVRDAMKKIFNASIVPEKNYGKEEDNEAEDRSSDNFDFPQEQTVEQPHVEEMEHQAYNMTEEMKRNLLLVLRQALSKKNTSADFIMAYFKFACTCRADRIPKMVLGDDLPQFRKDVLQLMPRFDSELYTSVSRWGREHARLLRSMRSGLEFFKEDIVDDDLKESFKNFMDEGDAPDELHFKLKDYAGDRAEWDTGADPIDLRACEPSTHTWWSELERKDSYIKFGT